MPQENEIWFQSIAKSLAFLCLQHVTQSEPKRAPDLIAKVRFLETLGIPINDAAELLGTTANSINTNLRQRQRNKKQKK